MNRHQMIWLVVAITLVFGCTASYRPNLEYFTKTVLTKYADSSPKLRNLQFYLDESLELEGVIETESAAIGEYHELIVRKNILYDHVIYADGVRGTVIKIDPEYHEIWPKIKKWLKMDVSRTLWVCFESNIERVLPFCPDASGYYVLQEKNAGSNKVLYGGKEYTILSKGRKNGLLYDLDYEEDLKTQYREQDGGRGFK